MKHANFKLISNFPLPIFEDFSPIPPPPTGFDRRILPDGTYRIYFNSAAEKVYRIVKVDTP